MKIYQTAVELLFCNCSIGIFGSSAPSAVPDLLGCFKLTRINLPNEIQ